MKQTFRYLAALVAAAFCFSPSTTKATVVLEVEAFNNTGSGWTADGSMTLVNPTVASVNLTTTSSNSVTVTLAVSNPYVGNAYDAQLRDSITIGSGLNSGATNSEEVLITAINSTVHQPPNLGTFTASASTSSVSAGVTGIGAKAAYDPGNNPFASFNGTSFAAPGSVVLTILPTNMASAQPVFVPLTGSPFSLTTLAGATFSGEFQSASFTSQADVTTPEPGSMLLWGLALTGAAGTGLRRRFGAARTAVARRF